MKIKSTFVPTFKRSKVHRANPQTKLDGIAKRLKAKLKRRRRHG